MPTAYCLLETSYISGHNQVKIMASALIGKRKGKKNIGKFGNLRETQKVVLTLLIFCEFE